MSTRVRQPEGRRRRFPFSTSEATMASLPFFLIFCCIPTVDWDWPVAGDQLIGGNKRQTRRRRSADRRRRATRKQKRRARRNLCRCAPTENKTRVTKFGVTELSARYRRRRCCSDRVFETWSAVAPRTRRLASSATGHSSPPLPSASALQRYLSVTFRSFGHLSGRPPPAADRQAKDVCQPINVHSAGKVRRCKIRTVAKHEPITIVLVTTIVTVSAMCRRRPSSCPNPLTAQVERVALEELHLAEERKSTFFRNRFVQVENCPRKRYIIKCTETLRVKKKKRRSNSNLRTELCDLIMSLLNSPTLELKTNENAGFCGWRASRSRTIPGVNSVTWPRLDVAAIRTM